MYTRLTYKHFIVFFFCLFLFLTNGRGQNVLDSLDNQIVADTIHQPDSITPTEKKSAIEAPIDRTCNDSTIQDFKNNKIFYYGNAVIKYDDIEIQADYVEFDFDKHTIFAKGMPDSTGKIVGKPVFTQNGQKYYSDEMSFNFDTKKGIIRKVFTEDSQSYIHGNKIKKMEDGKINVQSGSFTTCNNRDHPHYEFHFRKAIVIPEDKIVAKHMYLKIEETPLPVAIPFALIPNSKGQRSGILIPSFGQSANRGYYFENGGYYWAINEYMDLQLTGDIYTRGSWAVKPLFRYVNRYKYSGSFNANYALNKIGTEGSADYQETTDFKIRWIHKQDAKARPKSSFSADVYIVSNNYNKYNGMTVTEHLSNTFQSSIAFQTSFANLFFLTLNGSHSQNTISHNMTITLPEATLSMNRVYPFRNIGKRGKKHWYSEINVNYTVNAKNYISMADSLFFKPGWTDHLQNGIQHRAPINMPIKLFKYFTWTTTLNLNDKMYFQYYKKEWVAGDSTSAGKVVTDTIPHFRNVFTYDVSSNITTKIYGMLQFKKGPIRAVRHVFTPTFGFSYNPDFSAGYWDYYSTYTDGEGVEHSYSYFQGSIYGAPPGQRSGRITYNLSNNLEIKVPSRKDTITGLKKVVLIENLTFSGNYDLAKDSLNWSYLSISGRTTLFKNFSIQYSSLWDPYILDSTGTKQLNKFEWDVNHRLFRKKSVTWNFSATYTFNNSTFSSKKSKTQEKKYDIPNSSEQELNDIYNNPNDYVDWSTTWSISLSYNLRINNNPTYVNYVMRDNRSTIQTIGLHGEINLSPKWKFSAQSGWDFEQRKVSYTSLTIYRDLHCWEMRFNVIPYGTYKSWNFQINVKASALQDLKLTKKKDYRDNY
ncbi:MAG: LPS-assembly protein LptD [Bacteroidales bacterium]|nr:LPS-assembly protein LptD [Bacteroidales bacterium]